jgi:catechol 2,3-dioxygenase-like lactoylglutathione lyase family enzyme
MGCAILQQAGRIQSMSVKMLTHIGICGSDLPRARAFYTDVLGMKEVGGLETAGESVDQLLGLPAVDLEAVYLERDGFRLELLHYRSPGHQGKSEPPRPMNLLGLTHLSLRVANLAEICRRIEAAGGRVLRETWHENPERRTRVCMGTDPDGLRLELIEAPGDPALIPQVPRRQ